MKKSVIFLLMALAVVSIEAAVIKGKIVDAENGEALIGVTVQLMGTTSGAVSDLDGCYVIPSVQNGKHSLEVRYLSYQTIHSETFPVAGSDVLMNFQMEADHLELGTVTISARKNLESELSLLKERQMSAVAVENLGSKEMSLKGISTASDGVKKMTGIAEAEAGQLIVRGLGDRYSSTALNGLPIASPNPDNKLVPLDLFQSSIIKNIVVQKVYYVGNYADYSGAYIDINTKESVGDPFFKISISGGGQLNAFSHDFYQSNKLYGLWKTNSISDEIIQMKNAHFQEYCKTTDVFGTTFDIANRTIILPDFGASLSFGREIPLGNNYIGIMASLSIKNEHQVVENMYDATYTVQGTQINEFVSNSYTSSLNMASLANLAYHFRESDNIGYTLLYARNATDNYKLRNGYDDEDIHIVGSNSVMHIYHLMMHQLKGNHALGDCWKMAWGGSYGLTGSDEPDRRQVMYRYTDDETTLKLFSLNQQETMRYFGVLNESEWAADVKAKYTFPEDKGYFQFGAAGKNKSRDFQSTRFYYNISSLDPEIGTENDIYDTGDYLNQENVAAGSIIINKDNQPRYSYSAGAGVAAGFVDMLWNIRERFSMNVGLRFEQSNRWVHYWNDASIEKISSLNSADLFPAINLKYNIDDLRNIKFSLSKTVTRPGFIEMAPFLYKESYGSEEIRGNENLKNGYNYNLDLRLDLFSKSSDYLSVATYLKWLINPIERVQELAGGAAVSTFMNAGNGMAAGLEVDGSKTLFNHLKAGLNASLIYTNVILPENGVYTDDNRALQGASPYLVNADLTYMLNLKDNQSFSAALLYNLQGPRIHTVGINGVENVIQQAVNTLHLVGAYHFSSRCGISLKVKDLLNPTLRYTQKIKDTGEQIVVKSYRSGMGIELGCQINL